MQRTTYFRSPYVSILGVEESELYLLLYISLFPVLVSLFPSFLFFFSCFWSFVIVIYFMIIYLICPYRCFMYMFITNLK